MGLCEVIAVGERHSGDVLGATVKGFHSKRGVTRRIGFSKFDFDFRLKFVRKLIHDLTHDTVKLIGVLIDPILGLRDHLRAVDARPWTHSGKSAVHQSHRRQAIKGWVNPTVERNVGRASIGASGILRRRLMVCRKSWLILARRCCAFSADFSSFSSVLGFGWFLSPSLAPEPPCAGTAGCCCASKNAPGMSKRTTAPHLTILAIPFSRIDGSLHQEFRWCPHSLSMPHSRKFLPSRHTLDFGYTLART